MCFSATASFGASGVLLVIGAASVLRAGDLRQLPFAMVPVLFAVQQFAEGFLWLSLEGRFPGQEKVLTHFYLFFAQVLWPIWIPLAFLWLERKKNRRILLKIISAIGILVGGYLAHCLLTYEAMAEIRGHHIKYILDYPKPLQGYGNLLYGLATLAPAFVSGIKGMKLFGLLVMLSYFVSFFYFRDALISVWCYFAALISISVWYLVPSYIQDRWGELEELDV
jgi:hypothetical protein